jgi:hypothetical protein
MKVKSILTEVLLEQFCNVLEHQLEISSPVSFPPELENLLKEAKKLGVFANSKTTNEEVENEKLNLNIDPTKPNYVIAGSARLHLYPKIKEIITLTPINDLDIVYEKLKTNKIESPDKKIEIFNKWDPNQVPKNEKPKPIDFTVRSTPEILKSAKMIGGYRFMSFYDILDYKLNLNRPKENQLVIKIVEYLNNKDPKIQNEIIKIFLEDEQGKKDFESFLSPKLVSLARKQAQKPTDTEKIDIKKTKTA